MERLAFPVAAFATLLRRLGGQRPSHAQGRERRATATIVYVPPGAFQMGDSFGDGDARERPVHAVELDAFYIAQVSR